MNLLQSLPNNGFVNSLFSQANVFLLAAHHSQYNDSPATASSKRSADVTAENPTKAVGNSSSEILLRPANFYWSSASSSSHDNSVQNGSPTNHTELNSTNPQSHHAFSTCGKAKTKDRTGETVQAKDEQNGQHTAEVSGTAKNGHRSRDKPWTRPPVQQKYSTKDGLMKTTPSRILKLRAASNKASELRLKCSLHRTADMREDARRHSTARIHRIPTVHEIIFGKMDAKHGSEHQSVRLKDSKLMRYCNN